MILSIHDVSDIFLEFSKSVNYFGFETLSKVTFIAFAVVFLVTRLFVFPLMGFYFPTWAKRRSI